MKTQEIVKKKKVKFATSVCGPTHLLIKNSEKKAKKIIDTVGRKKIKNIYKNIFLYGRLCFFSHRLSFFNFDCIPFFIPTHTHTLHIYRRAESTKNLRGINLLQQYNKFFINNNNNYNNNNNNNQKNNDNMNKYYIINKKNENANTSWYRKNL